jgi:ADP-heptose:LPS heptosyltransferase
VNAHNVRVSRTPNSDVLVVRALGLGDLLTAVPALQAIADAFPDHRRILAAPAALEPIAAMSGAVDELVDASPLEPIRVLRPPDVAINLHGRGPQSHAVALATRPRRLIAFEHRDVPRSWGSPRWRADEHEVHRWCRLLAESGIPADPGRLELAPPRRSSGADGATVIHPGAASAARRWPVERWAEVAAAEAGAGRLVLISGSPAERRAADELAARAGLPASSVIAGTTDVEGLAATVASAALVLCGDTGVAHLATAFGTASVVLFGPTPPARWGPPTSERHVVLWRGRSGDPHAAVPHDGLLEITVDDVLAAIERVRGSDHDRGWDLAAAGPEVGR